MTRVEQSMRAIDSFDRSKKGNRNITFGECVAIRERSGGDQYSALFDAFTLGFIKGQRAEKARRKEKK